ncbi:MULTISPECIES: lytic transglycosylase domain-containing protein [unclassified Microcella]|uniref:aggregation-promoting factor C-terminal-like domain-containing protein n=1 Tax=unclassified Microcella TaxID=2630066 RepID=UPI000B2F1182|nr:MULTISPECIES: lytic transglycosylase domain-containing protein [unclassified Microcella]
MSLALVSISDTSTPAAAIEAMAPASPIVGQEFTATAEHSIGASLASYEIVEPAPEPEPAPASFSAPAAGIPDPGSAKAIAADMVAARGWGSGEFDCLVALWNKESGWNVYAMNSSSGAYGIPQALPGSKMATAGADWQTNAATQITWGLGYIQARYGTPCGAWAHSQSVGWY